MALATSFFEARIWFAGCLALLAGINQALGDAPAAETEFAARAERSFQEAQARYQEAANDATNAWQFGRACFELAEYATNHTQRASLAEKGIKLCRLAVVRETNSAPAHYYLGMNLGQLARTKGLGALRLVDQMEREFLRARALDEHIDCAGPDRHLGQLYHNAPVFGSVGSRTRAREHLKRAVELAPVYPENRLDLVEAYMSWGERTSAHRELQALEANWAAARTNFVGESWAANWADWEPRLEKLRKKIEEPAKPLATPREKQ